MRPLTAAQRSNLTLVSRGHVTSRAAAGMDSLVARGLVEDLGLYDYQRHTRRYGSDRYRITDAGVRALTTRPKGAR